jgi:hypothetical protein
MYSFSCTGSIEQANHISNTGMGYFSKISEKNAVPASYHAQNGEKLCGAKGFIIPKNCDTIGRAKFRGDHP